MANKIENLIGDNIHILSCVISRVNELRYLKQVSDVPLNQSQLLIMRIINSGEEMTGSRISSVLGITRAAASQNISYLTNNGLIKYQEQTGDRRRKVLELTVGGKDLVRQFNSLRRVKRQEVLENFSEKEKSQFNSLLEKYVFHRMKMEDDLRLFCLECGGEYEDSCPISNQKNGCLFKLS